MPREEPSALVAMLSDVSLATVSSEASLVAASSSSSSSGPTPPKVSRLMGQASFNDFVRDLELCPGQVEVAGSRMREYNFLKKSTRTTFLRTDKSFSALYKNVELDPLTKSMKRVLANGQTESYVQTFANTLTYCDNLEGLFSAFEEEFVASHWRLFIDASTESLKVALLDNKNVLPTVIVGYSRYCPENYDNMKQILSFIKYEKYKFLVILDFKLINIIQGHMAAASKFPCIHCLWEARYDRDDRYTKTDWTPRPEWDELIGPRNNAIKKPLVPRDKILFPPLHIKIGLMTQLMKKILETNDEVFLIIKTILPALSDAKVKGGIFDGPEIRKLFNSKDLLQVMNNDEQQAFLRLKDVSANFLGNNRADDFNDRIKNMMLSYETLDINITIKMHSLICHMDLFPDSCGQMSDEQGERVHQTLKKIEHDYKGKDMVNGLGLYCFSLVREKSPLSHKRQTRYDKKMSFFQKNK